MSADRADRIHKENERKRDARHPAAELRCGIQPDMLLCQARSHLDNH